MRGTTVPRKEQNKAFDEDIGQPDERLRVFLEKAPKMKLQKCATYTEIKPSEIANLTKSAFVLNPSFLSILLRCVSTVRVLM